MLKWMLCLNAVQKIPSYLVTLMGISESFSEDENCNLNNVLTKTQFAEGRNTTRSLWHGMECALVVNSRDIIHINKFCLENTGGFMSLCVSTILFCLARTGRTPIWYPAFIKCEVYITFQVPTLQRLHFMFPSPASHGSTCEPVKTQTITKSVVDDPVWHFLDILNIIISKFVSAALQIF